MKRNATVVACLLTLTFVFATNVWAQYLTQDFEAAFTGTPAAPPGWTQSRVVLLGDGVPEPTGVDGEKDWEQNINTGAGTWSKNPSSTTTVKPNAAVSGTGVLYMQDYNFGSTSSGGFGSRRVESPTINLAASTSPYVRFWYFYAATAGANNVRVMASSNGGTTWNSIMIITSNAAIVGTMTSATPWQRINVVVPAAYRTATAKVGIEMTNTWGVQDIFIDDLSVEEFTPTGILSAASGNWSAPATWAGGVVPTADNNAQVDPGHVVTIDVNTARCQQMSVAGTGTLNFASTGGVLQALQNFLVSAGGTYSAFNGTTGKPTFIAGVFQNDGIADFSVGTPTVWFTGGSPGNVTGAGTYTNSRIVAVNFANAHGFTVSAPVTITGAVGLIDGTVNPQGLLTLGNPAAVLTQTISVGRGSFSGAPIFAAGMTSRSTTYTQFFAQPANTTTITPGEENELITGVRTVTGTLTITTFNNVSLGYPLSVGNVAGTTGALSMSRGILTTTPANLLTVNSFATGSAGAVPSILTPPTTHGSYVVGPVRINFPATGTTSRNFPLGLGTGFNGATPNSNVKKTANLANTAAWASQTITASLGASPSGTVTPPINGVFGAATLRLNLNGGPDLPATSTLTWVGRNSTFGNSDAMTGGQAELRLAQATTPTGSWAERTTTSGTGAFVNNTDYTRTTASAAPGPIGPLATNGEYFALATTFNAAVPPGCATIVSPADGATNIAPTATLNWAAGTGVPTGYKLSFGTDNPPTNILNNSDRGNVLTYDPTPDMAFSTTYYWKVVPYNAGGDATGCAVWSFTTGADPTISSFPYAEGFEAIAFPPYGYTTTGTLLWTRGTESFSGAGCARILYSPAHTGSILLSPKVVLPSNYRISFWWKDDDITGSPMVQGQDTTWFEVSTNGGTTWISLDTLSTPTNESAYHQLVRDLSAYAGNNFYFRWRDNSNGSLSAWGTGVDSIRIEVNPTGPPNCAGIVGPVDAATGVQITDSLRWSAPGSGAIPTGYKLFFGTDNPPTNLVNGTNLGLVLKYVPPAALSYTTTYFWKIVPTNGSGDATGCPVWSFTTQSNPNWGGGGAGTGGYYFANSTPQGNGLPSQPGYNWIDPIASGHTQILEASWLGGATSPGDDGYFGPVTLPLSFSYFGAAVTDVYIGTNGLLRFGTPMYRAAYGPATFPNATDTNRTSVTVAWMDLDTRGSLYPGAAVYYGGDATQFVVTWLRVHDFGSTTDSATFQVILSPNGNIKMQYNDALSTSPFPASINNDLISGIENPDGTLGVGYRVNGVGGPVISSPVAVAFGTNQNTLPIQLGSFTARINQTGGVRINWTTIVRRTITASLFSDVSPERNNGQRYPASFPGTERRPSHAVIPLLTIPSCRDHISTACVKWIWMEQLIISIRFPLLSEQRM